LSGSTLAAGSLVLLAIVAFAPAFSNGFVHLDDEASILKNPHFQGLGWAQLAWAWRTHLLGVYHPLAWMLLSAQSATWGLDPTGYHVVSVVLHGVVTAMLFLVIARLLARARTDLPSSDRLLGAASATALFAVHPLRSEVVAWTSCHHYLPSAFFFLLGVCLHIDL
jgi:protein O-mannosyl-transferase